MGASTSLASSSASRRVEDSRLLRVALRLWILLKTIRQPKTTTAVITTSKAHLRTNGIFRVEKSMLFS